MGRVTRGAGKAVTGVAVTWNLAIGLLFLVAGVAGVLGFGPADESVGGRIVGGLVCLAVAWWFLRGLFRSPRQ